MTATPSPFELIRRTNPAGNEFWSSRDFAKVLDYTDYRNFEAVIEKARTACFNSGQRVEDHFVEITEMIPLGKGAQRASRFFATGWRCKKPSQARNAWVCTGAQLSSWPKAV